MSIEKLSRSLNVLFLIPLIGLPCMWVYFFIDISVFKSIVEAKMGNLIIWNTVELWQLYLLCLMLFLNCLILLWGLVNLRMSFRAFAKSEVFVDSNIFYIKQFSLSLVVFSIINTFSYSIASVLLSVNHPPGQKVLSIQINSTSIGVLLIGLVFWLIAKILLKARDLELDNNAIV